MLYPHPTSPQKATKRLCLERQSVKKRFLGHTSIRMTKLDDHCMSWYQQMLFRFKVQVNRTITPFELTQTCNISRTCFVHGISCFFFFFFFFFFVVVVVVVTKSVSRQRVDLWKLSRKKYYFSKFDNQNFRDFHSTCFMTVLV